MNNIGSPLSPPESHEMAYRAVNDGQWSISFLGEGCESIIGLTRKQLAEQGKVRMSDILQRSSNQLPDESSLISDDGTSFKLEYLLLSQTGEELRVIERGVRIFDDMGALIAIEGFLTVVADD